MTPLLGLFLAASLGATDADYLVLDVRTREVLENHWVDADVPIPVGSLVKPFLALAWGGAYPDFTCHGSSDKCWLARGHGRLKFRDALAVSCNAYFLNLARGVDAAALAVTAGKFGIPAPPSDSAEERIGLGTGWKIAPLALGRAYCELAARAEEPQVEQVLAGLEGAARSGTASAIGSGSLAKTGTARCVAARKHAGDGFVLVLDPADKPRIALLVRVHGVPGAEAAKTAARILKVVRAER
jgi:cell division protein FtsI/penicillin-binding protein 2